MGCRCGGKRISANANKKPINNMKNQPIIVNSEVQGQKNVRNMDNEKNGNNGN